MPEGQQAGGAWLLFAYLKFAEAAGERGVPAATRRRPPGAWTRYPSALARPVAAALTWPGVASSVYWGNDGFCVDVAPHGSDAGVLVDGCRYAAAGDVVDWDVFRTGVLAGQGWRLTRVWSPHLFRDPEGVLRGLAERVRVTPLAARGERATSNRLKLTHGAASAATATAVLPSRRRRVHRRTGLGRGGRAGADE